MTAEPIAAPAAAGGFTAVSPAHYRLELPLRFANVADVRARGLHILESAHGGALTFDLAGVSSVDSAGLALLIDWLATARARGGSLRYVAIPDSLLALAKMSDVESLLGLDTDASAPPVSPSARPERPDN
jgi:phospholipid transport system transporter-binding protein